MTLDILALIVGIHSGLLLGAILFLTYILMTRRREEDHDEDDDRRPDRSVGGAMSTLCSAVNHMNPGWHTIEITRDGDSSASMVVKSDGSPGDEPDNKLH